MAQEQDLVITLKRVSFEERHLIVTGLTRFHGLISVLARNAIQSRRFGGALQTFTAAQWVWQEKSGRTLSTLEGITLRKDFSTLAQDPQALAVAGFLGEFFLKVISPQEPVPEVFKLFAHALSLLEKKATLPEAIFHAVLLKYLDYSGHRPRLKDCLGCGKSVIDFSGSTMFKPVFESAGFLGECCFSQNTKNSIFIKQKELFLLDQVLSEVNLSQALTLAPTGEGTKQILLMFYEFFYPEIQIFKFKSQKFLREMNRLPS